MGNKECAALLYEGTQGIKESVFVSVYVRDEAMARQIAQILLEASIRNLVSEYIFEKGPESWRLTSAETISQGFFDQLQKITGTFHGPETHLNGAGPVQMHYNAGVYHGGKPVNTHIFFG